MFENKKKLYYSGREKRANEARKEASESVMSRELTHVQGHRTSVTRVKGDFMCPECSKTFDNTERAEEHLHSEHFEHLRIMHGELHDKDKNQQH
jgi:hypothetical protein